MDPRSSVGYKRREMAKKVDCAAGLISFDHGWEPRVILCKCDFRRDCTPSLSAITVNHRYRDQYRPTIEVLIVGDFLYYTVI